MQILGITGAIGHGKTSLAKAFLREIPDSSYTESSLLISEVANKLNWHYITLRPSTKSLSGLNAWLAMLPEILKDVANYQGNIKPVHLTDPQTLTSDPDFIKLAEYLDMVEANHALVMQPINPDTKELFRPILQWLGNYVTKHIDPNLWYSELIRQAKLAEVDGTKLFVIGGVRYPSDAQQIHDAGGKVISIERPNLQTQDAVDPTEAYRSLVTVDSTVINDGLLGTLDGIVLDIWKDLSQDELKPTYQASRSGLSPKSAPNFQNRGMAI